MRSYHYALLSLALCASFRSVALNVSVYNPITSHCGGPTGLLQALIGGGVPPYSVLWSNGATTEIINGLPPGTYNVTVTDLEGTQATAQGDVISQSLLSGGQTYANLVHCPGGYPMVDLTLHNQWQWGVPIYGTPPFTITGPAAVVSSNAMDCVACGIEMDSLIRVEMNVAPGSSQTITWTDAFGCPGESMVIMSTEAVWPQVQVYSVQGACAGANNGSFSFTIDGGSRYFTAIVQDPFGTPLGYAQVTNGVVATQTRNQLGPGDHLVIVLTESIGPTDDELCADTTIITIPDLGSGCGNVSGPVFIDGNSNCTWSAAENRLPQAIVEITPGPYYASTNGVGNYSANLPLGTYDHTIIHPGAQQECPGPFTLSGTQPFVIEPIGCSSLFSLDVEVSVSNGPARPGFDMFYAVNVRNNTAANAGATTITLVYDATLVFNSASPTPASVVGNTITWNLFGVSTYANATYHLSFTVPPDVGLIGTTLNCLATVSTTNTDVVPANNTVSSAKVITGSFDPNSKEAQTSSRWSDELYYIDVDQYIDHTLHFQNTGTDTAFLVVVTDTLPPTLDPASVRVGAASHPFTWTLAGTGVLAFNFANIQLPDSNVNEAASHGFVSFRIKPRQPLTAGTVIENIANIYFDFNPPIITEPSVLVAEFSTGLEAMEPGGLIVFPVPVQRTLSIYLQDPADQVAEWMVMSVDGRVLERGNNAAGRSFIEVGRLSAGTYLFWIRTQAGTVHQRRFVKE